jgi:hypothetical protein
MKTRVPVGSLICLLASACNAFDAPGESASSDVYYAPVEVAAPVPGFGYVSGGNVVDSGSLALEAELDGELRGIDLDGRTTENYGNYELWDDGGGYLNFSVAGPGDSGAGMLIVSLSHPRLAESLLSGHWSSAETPDLNYSYSTGTPTGATVSSCAGPTVGEWPWEMGAVDYDMTAEEDPERPDTVVLTVVSQFPLSEGDVSGRTRQLTGTVRFQRLAP